MVSHGEKLSVNQFAEKSSSELGLSKPEIYRYLSLLNLSPEVKEKVSSGVIGVKNFNSFQQPPNSLSC